MRRVLLAAAAALLVQAGAVRAASSTLVDYSDLWWNPAESGWGAHLTLQGDVLFAVLFVHDDQRQGTFLVASDMRPVASTDGATTFAGALYRTTGSPLARAYDPSRFSAAAVGQARIAFDSPTSARLAYDADGRTVTRTITRQTWRPVALGGRYFGGLQANASQCNVGTGAATLSFPGYVDVTQSGSAIVLDTRFEPGFAEVGTCRYAGQLASSGSIATVTQGTFACTFSNDTSYAGTFEIADIQVSDSGFFGRFRGLSGACATSGHFGAFRRIDPPATESPQAMPMPPDTTMDE